MSSARPPHTYTYVCRGGGEERERARERKERARKPLDLPKKT